MEARVPERDGRSGPSRLEQQHANWAALPATVVRHVAVVAGDLAALRWCGSCRQYRDAQPALRVLSIGRDADTWVTHPALKNELRINIASTRSGHRVVEALSARHSGELTHLFMEAVHNLDDNKAIQWQDRQPVKLLAGPLAQYGKQLTSLLALDIYQPPAGFTGRVEPTLSLGSCATQLVRATAGTLRALSLAGPVRLSVDDAMTLVRENLLSDLHYVSVSCGNLYEQFVRDKGSEEDTQALQDAVDTQCSRLLAPAQVRCHYTRPPWQVYLGESCPDWTEPSRRAAWLDKHPCLERDETVLQTRDSHKHPAGYRGTWCRSRCSCVQADRRSDGLKPPRAYTGPEDAWLAMPLGDSVFRT